nr:meiotically up-regulated gene 190 protein [Quercus suber]
MQASLPSMVQMVSVDDIGQGSESLRILGIRWLPTGAAARSVASDGKLKSKEDKKHQNDRTVPGEGEVDDDAEDKKDPSDDKAKAQDDHDNQTSDDGADKEIAEGMEAEEGDFINLEVAFAYRARSGDKPGLKNRTKDMHLYLAFYLPANIKIPVWVDLRGVVGTMRMRLQLTPDPPFFALCTLTFLGQPKVDISCIPILKRAPNIMDLPLISNFVQSSVDAAMAQYVAPKSLTLDLKDMLAGDDFKKDSTARGVLVVRIKRGYDFKMGDPSIPLVKDGSADPYVSLGWAKFGKPLWSTRVLLKEMEPCWEETAYLLVTPDELNVDERLRVQLWDSDRLSADDDLGRIELDIKQLMKDDATNGKMADRTDGFRALKAGENMPGKLEWSIGYFSKVRIQPGQLKSQTFDPDVRTIGELDEKVDHICKRKLREANIKAGTDNRDAKELEQQKAQERKMREDAMMISAPPPDGYPSGIFSIQIHQITGLGLETLRKDRQNDGGDALDEAEEGEDLPSAYCTVIVNHGKAFKTRTKPKNAKPFYNAGVERYIPDWHTAEVYVSVRDARIKEDDPLLGIVHLPLGEVFKERSQINGFYPLTGGVGFGRIRLSMVWRSVQLQAPPEAIGWEYGTLEVKPGIEVANVPTNLQQMKIRFHTDIGFGKMYPHREDGTWQTRRKTNSLQLPVRRRYGSCVAVQFRQHGLVGDKTAAFAVLWLREIPDEDEKEITLPVWKGDFKRAIACCQESYGERLGEIRVKLTFWSGLGGAHSRWASKEPDMRDVVEVLDTARDNYESFESAKQAGIVDEEATSSSDEDSSSDSEDDDADEARAGDRDDGVDGELAQRRPDGGVRALGGPDGASTTDDDGGSSAGKQNVLDRAKDYKKHMKSEHRRNRGLMQWKVPRTAKWAVHKAEALESKVSGLLKHHDREPDIETEV